MRVLVACEFSGRVRDAFAKRGHDAWSCDIIPSVSNGNHIVGDVLNVLGDGWDLLIAHPPCTYLCNSGVLRLYRNGKAVNGRDPERWQRMEEGALFFKKLLYAPIPKICVENPIMHGYAKKIINRGQDQIIQPWMFGEDASKATGLWLKGLPKLEPTNIIRKERYANQTPSGQNKLGPSKDRASLRAMTYVGIAEAMADQWTPKQ